MNQSAYLNHTPSKQITNCWVNLIWVIQIYEVAEFSIILEENTKRLSRIILDTFRVFDPLFYHNLAIYCWL